MSQFLLMHENDVCGSMIIDDESGYIEAYKDHHNGKSPFLGNANEELIKKWWESRAVPPSRKAIKDIIKQSDCFNTKSYLAKNLALSMTDTYWIRPVDSDVAYENVKLTKEQSYEDGIIPYHNASSYDPNASLGGQMEKYWDLNSNTPVLVKESYKYYGQQALNESFATLLHKKQESNIPYVEYTVSKTKDNGMLCKCNSFTNSKTELISAYEIICSQKTDNENSLYENYIQICSKYGIYEDTIRNYMDYQTLTDFIISNSDEHLMNFGVLRDVNTMELIAPAPIYDSGNSMFYNEGSAIYSRVDMLKRKITSFYSSEEKMLKNVQNKHIVNLEALPNEDDLTTIYSKSSIPDEKIEAILKNYKTKIEMIHDFQHDIKISLYNEKKRQYVPTSQSLDF
ncbi:MAG: HipA domain-containing protein [Lachnospiraceae bacterium]|nr:HipA domain-containing protein [Lachnospiraceae bacterium]